MSQESEIAYAQGSPRYDTEMMDKVVEESNTEESGDTYTFPPSLIQPSYTTEGKSPSPRSFSKKSKSFLRIHNQLRLFREQILFLIQVKGIEEEMSIHYKTYIME